jgi:two-component system nitrogen regulation response regulator NtrX
MNEKIGQQILVVDDDANLRDLLSRFLEHHGFSVVTAADGPTAIQVVASQGPNLALVVLDMIMPGMDGEHVLQALRTLQPDMPCLCISGCSNANIITRMLQQGLCEFLTKPFSAGALLVKIEGLLQQYPRKIQP